MKPVELSVVINRPLEACFAYLTDLANDVEWRREWVEAEKTTDGPHGVGARYRLTGIKLTHGFVAPSQPDLASPAAAIFIDRGGRGHGELTERPTLAISRLCHNA